MKTIPMRTNESAAGSTRLLHRLTAALLALVLAASAALPVFAADTAPTDTIYINSVSDLLAFADKCREILFFKELGISSFYLFIPKIYFVVCV